MFVVTQPWDDPSTPIVIGPLGNEVLAEEYANTLRANRPDLTWKVVEVTDLPKVKCVLCGCETTEIEAKNREWVPTFAHKIQIGQLEHVQEFGPACITCVDDYLECEADGSWRTK